VKRLALIDADLLVYRFAFQNQEDFAWGDDTVSSSTDAARAVSGLDRFVEECLEECRADEYIVALSCPSADNFRLDFFPAYKANRADVERPALYGALRAHVAEAHPTYERPRLEADDVLGILATMRRSEPVVPIIVSLDKDLLTIPSRIYMPPMPQHGRPAKKRVVGPLEADWWHLYQTLVGDPADNYKGCPGIGPKKAERILGPVGLGVDVLWPRVLQAYEKAGLSEEAALLQARAARILRACDYDFGERCPVLWTPPN